MKIRSHAATSSARTVYPGKKNNMCRELIHIYGPISICSYGVMVFIGILLFTYLVNKDSARPKIMTSEQFFDALVFGTLVALVGARILFILTNVSSIIHWYDLFAVWDGGLSILGAIVAIIAVLPFYLCYRKISVLPFFDLCATYAALLQAISRIGCFFAGCCYGIETTVPWAIVYHDIRADAPVDVSIHPTQLYSAFLLFVIFLIVRFGVRRIATAPGQLLFTFLILSGAERFIVDFWRADREFFTFDHLHFLSIHQYISLGLALCSTIGLIIILQKARHKHHESL